MQAVIDRVLPQDDRAEHARIPILPFLDERLHLNRIEGYRYEDMPSDQEAYRLAVRAIDAMSHELYNKPFRELPTSSGRLFFNRFTMQNLSPRKHSGNR